MIVVFIASCKEIDKVLKMPIQALQWTDFKLCPVCQHEFKSELKVPISLGCGHTVCRSCLLKLSKQSCPIDGTEIKNDITKLPINNALLSLCGETTPIYFEVDIPELKNNRREFDAAQKALEALAECLQDILITNCNYTNNNKVLSKPMHQKIVSILNCQLAESEGRTRAMRAARSIGERAVKELVLMHQNSQSLSRLLRAVLKQHGCQFLGPGTQEIVLKLIHLSLEDGICLPRKTLVSLVIQHLEEKFMQASKTSIGSVVQLLYRASCFKVTKRDSDSSLLQLHEKYQDYSELQKEHDGQIVQIAIQTGLHISPEQWSYLLYADSGHKSHMQSVIDKLQIPVSFASSIQEFIIVLQRSDDPHNLQDLLPHLEKLASIDPNPEGKPHSWNDIKECLTSLLAVVSGLRKIIKNTNKIKSNIEDAHDTTKMKSNLEDAHDTTKNISNIEDSCMTNTSYACPCGAIFDFTNLEKNYKHMSIPDGQLFTGNITFYQPKSQANSCNSIDSHERILVDKFKKSNQISNDPSSSIIQQGKDFVNDSAASFKSQTISIHPSPPLYHLGPYITQKNPHYQIFSELREHQIQPAIHLQNNRRAIFKNPTVYQQQPAISQTYQYQQDYTDYPGMYVQPFSAHCSTTKTALATGNLNMLLKNNCDLNVNISPFQELKDDWKLSRPSRLDSFDTCSPQSNGLQSNEDVWGKSEIWGPPSFDLLKKPSNWSWKDLKDCRVSDNEEQSVSSDFVGKKRTPGERFFLTQKWVNDLNNNYSNTQELFARSKSAGVRPPPGFKLLSDD